jgi:hypothetical protein
MLFRRITVPEQHLCWSTYAGAPMLEQQLFWVSSNAKAVVLLNQLLLLGQ